MLYKMLSRILTAILLVISIPGAIAQNKDSLFVTFSEGDCLVPHKVMQGENVVSIAHAFHVPAATLADMNGIPATSVVLKKSYINIPIGEYNLLKSQPAKSVTARALYYRCKKGDNVFRIGIRTGIPQGTLKQWNNIEGSSFYDGQVLLIGWVLYDANHLENGQPAANGDNILLPTDTSSEAERTYLSQTGNEANVTDEKGPAVFYNAVGKAGSPFYAFHNGTSRGTIIKVYNPGNGKTIYVKVIGPLPATKQYYNSIIGISGTAKAALGVTESRAWCELKFSQN